MTNIVIVGAGGFGLEVAAYAQDMLRDGTVKHAIKGFLDNAKPADAKHAGFPVLGSSDSGIDPECLYVIAVGAPEARQKLAAQFSAKGARFISIIHPKSYIAESARIGDGSVIAPFAFAGPEARIGRHCLLNIYASAGHECSIGDCSTLSPYATVHGATILESGVFMGSHAGVTAKMRLGAGAKIAAGAVVYQDIPAGAHALGNPAACRKI